MKEIRINMYSSIQLSDEQWKSVKREANREFINNLKNILNTKESYHFCSCYEGDLYNRYKTGVQELLGELIEENEKN